jgi:hypothetical protein
MPRPAPSARRATPARKPSIVPALALIVLFGAGIGIIFVIRSQPQGGEREASAAEPAEHVPFAAYHEERPAGAGPARPAAVPLARPSRIQGSGPTADPIWIAAWDEADKGYALLEEANAARERQDHAEYAEKGKLAKEAFDRALTMSAEWEEQLIAERGDDDTDVRRIVATRSDWFDKMRVLHRTTGR